MKSEVLGKGDTGYEVEEWRHEMVRDGDKAWHWTPPATNSSTMSVAKTAHLELDKIEFRVTTRTQK